MAKSVQSRVQSEILRRSAHGQHRRLFPTDSQTAPHPQPSPEQKIRLALHHHSLYSYLFVSVFER
ncbi:hypothetical protein EYF80_023693 [Liparis tanakae]|uniref:Uncharacterized protein n=1 Tax=Liparis tanakae TaxID=230148 RepID=A0A4Z2HL83_9TELE|nr:hypothetical protein EYF80_023693 [Liparis tanakae]